MRNKLKNMKIPEKYLDVRTWEPVDTSHLSNKELTDFLCKKEAIDLYFLTSIPIKDICKSSCISPRTLYLLIERCLTFKNRGNIYGYSAIFPYARINNIQQKFDAFISQHRELHDLIVKKFKTYKLNKTTNFRIIHQFVLKWCYQNGITENQYPFTLSDNGYRSLLRYYNEWAKTQDLFEKENFSKMTIKQLPKNCLSPLIEVEIDGHRIDAYFITEFQTPSGTWREAVIERPWILCTIDRSTRCVLGFELVLKSEYDSMDVLSCIEKSVIPITNEKIPGTLSVKTFPNQVFPQIEYALFDELYLDNAKAHLSDSLLNTLIKKMGTKVCFGKVAEPTRRGIIERFFKTLEEKNFHQFPSTTGSSPTDPRRQSPEKKAKQYHISIDDLEKITYLALYEYNNTPHSSLYGNSPLEDFRQKLNSRLYTYLPITLRDGNAFHLLKDSRTVVANNKESYLHINYAGAKYTSQRLNGDKKMIGENLLLQINFKDIRVIKAFYSSGEFYDDLFVEKKWRGRKHDLKERKLINKLSREGEFTQLNQLNILETYDNYLVNKNIITKKTGSRIANIKKTISEESLNKVSDHLAAATDKDNNKRDRHEEDLKNHRKLRGTPVEIKGLNL